MVSLSETLVARFTAFHNRFEEIRDGVIEIRNPQTGKFEAKRASDPMWGRIILRSAAAGGGT